MTRSRSTVSVRTKRLFTLVAASGLLAASAGVAQPAPADQAASASPALASSSSSFETYKTWLAGRARAEGVSERTVAALAPLALNLRAIELDRAQAPSPIRTAAATVDSSPPLQPYLRSHVTSSLIWRGQSRYYSLWPQLVQLQQRFGVDPATLLAIYGKETSYGFYTGNFDLLEALTSLAFEGRRRTMFEKEVLATLKLMDAGVPRERLKGSYAGATGYPQFMPTVVLRLRADGDGDGQSDIWSNEVDALASVANYFRNAGWKNGLPWGAPASVPASLDRSAIRSTDTDTRCPSVFRRHSRLLPVAEWQRLGVRPSKPLPADALASLIEPQGPGEQPYLTTANYRVILSYNCSNYYATSVALLSDAIARR